MQAENKEVFIHIVLICDKQADIAPVLNGLWPYNEHQESEPSSPRLIDLHILKIKSSKNKTGILNIIDNYSNNNSQLL